MKKICALQRVLKRRCWSASHGSKIRMEYKIVVGASHREELKLWLWHLMRLRSLVWLRSIAILLLVQHSTQHFEETAESCRRTLLLLRSRRYIEWYKLFWRVFLHQIIVGDVWLHLFDKL